MRKEIRGNMNRLSDNVPSCYGYLRAVLDVSCCNVRGSKGAITSKIKHAIKLKTSPARLAQLLQPSLGRPYGVTGGLIKCS